MNHKDENQMEKFIEQMEVFCNDSFQIAKDLDRQGFKEGLGFYHFGRYVSCFMGVKTLMYAFDKFGTGHDFADEYINKLLPSYFPRRDIEIAQRYVKETHMALRFVLFQNFYSQTEFTYRIIQRAKFPQEENSNPFNLITNKYGILSLDFVKFMNSIRNTIHNNGYYFPKDKTPLFKYNFNGKEFVFEYGKPIDAIRMEDIFEIINYFIEENKKLFHIKELADIKFY